ncbi:MAG: hypothetical protein KatS3mg115_0951 [Candidatus Poribacteria bacterium]|nr:MAG: hypothetical protein KatS3mg115_0951 [Candidatus Poribacteria bacterium]
MHPYERPIQRKWAQRRARKGARRLIAQELERVLLQGIGLDWEQPEQLHRLRIALKRLRYTVDLFGDLLDGGRSPIIRPLKRLQDGFGAVQDAEVHLRLLQELTARLRAERPDACQEETTTWDHLRGLLNTRRTAALGEARAQWERFCAPEFLERIAQTYRLNLSAHQDSLQEATAP